MDQRILRLSMKDTARNSMLALPLIIILEIYMIFSWFQNVTDKDSVKAVGYMICYISLLVISLIVFIYLIKARKNIDRHLIEINYIQHIYSFLLVVWAYAFTYIGSEIGGRFDYLIFITVITIIPLFCYLRPLLWILMQLTATAGLFYLASHQDHYYAFLVNFSVFTIISIAAGWSMHHIRYSSYLRQIQLEEDKNYESQLAHFDALTGLPNRQSYTEELARLNSVPISEEYTVVIFDVNGLKKANDTYGHIAGDILLKQASECMQKAFSAYGTVYRIGGDEFTAMLTCTEQQLFDSIKLFEDLTSSYEGEYFKGISVALGYASFRDDVSASVSSLITKADNAMYEAKRRHYQMSGNKDK